MDIEAIVKKYKEDAPLRSYDFDQSDAETMLRAALTELSQEYEQRIRQLEAQRVPVSVLEGMVNLVEGLPAYDWRSNKTGMRLKDASAWVKFYCAAKGAMLAAAPAPKEGE